MSRNLLLSDYKARRCATAVGILVRDDKVLLVFHKKLNIWLAPGGHMEKNELPHVAAEREFLEETGVKVKAVSATNSLIGVESEYLPTPLCVNLHWVSEDNYQQRLGQDDISIPVKSAKWPKGCEQHYSFVYLVKEVDDNITLVKNLKETHDLGWFDREEIRTLPTTSDIRNELELAIQTISINTDTNG
jgi:ADP-ribose pyrophosphatase YjhB (NUDIX family)